MAPASGQLVVRYIEAVHAAVVDLEHDETGEPVRAGIRLALLAWDQLAEADLSWDDVALAMVAADEVLRPVAPDTTAVCAAPVAGDSAVSAVVARLVQALAVRARLLSTERLRPASERLAWDAAARELDRAVAVLP